MGPARRVKFRFGIGGRRWGFARRPQFGRRVVQAAGLQQETAPALVTVHEQMPAPRRDHAWPVLAAHGSLEVRIAESEYEIEASQRLRYRVFYEEMSAIPTPKMREEQRDFDRYDEFCDHMLVIDREVRDAQGEPAVVGTYRLLRGEVAARHGGYYTSSEYDLTPDAEGQSARHTLSRARPLLRAQELSRQGRHHAAAVARHRGLSRPLCDRCDVRLRLASRHRSRRAEAAALLSPSFPQRAGRASAWPRGRSFTSP